MRRALVLGDAATVHDDAAAALKLFMPDAVFAVNNIGLRWPDTVDFWCTLHPMPCANWVGMAVAVRQRVDAGRNRPETWAHKPREGIDFHTRDWGGSSGLLAVKVALEKGMDRIVLAGVPMTAEPHFYADKPWKTAGMYMRGWRKHRNFIADRVRSMSGWTRQFLGEPTAEWLEGSD